MVQAVAVVLFPKPVDRYVRVLEEVDLVNKRICRYDCFDILVDERCADDDFRSYFCDNTKVIQEDHV